MTMKETSRLSFRPEFYNRIDMCLTFDPLEEAAIRQITRRELAAIPKREGITQRKLQFSFTEDLIAFLAIAGFHIKYGSQTPSARNRAIGGSSFGKTLS